MGLNRKQAGAIAGAVLAAGAIVFESTQDDPPVTPAGTELMVSGAALGSTAATQSVVISEGAATAPLTNGASAVKTEE